MPPWKLLTVFRSPLHSFLFGISPVQMYLEVEYGGHSLGEPRTMPVLPLTLLTSSSASPSQGIVIPFFNRIPKRPGAALDCTLTISSGFIHTSVFTTRAAFSPILGSCTLGMASFTLISMFLFQVG